MIEVASHQKVENMVIFQEVDTILHQVINELAEHNLFCGSILEIQQGTIYLINRFMSKEDREVSL